MHVRDAFDLLPLRQVVTAGEGTEPAFARQPLLNRLSKPQRYAIVGHGSGGQILAAGERALAEARTVLRQAYGPAIAFGTPVVHSYVDPQAGARMVPVLFLRIDAPRAHGPQLQQLLKDHGADLQQLEMRRERVVLRAEIELARALDLESGIAEITDGASQVLSWLVRYQPASPGAAPGSPGSPHSRSPDA